MTSDFVKRKNNFKDRSFELSWSKKPSLGLVAVMGKTRASFKHDCPGKGKVWIPVGCQRDNEAGCF